MEKFKLTGGIYSITNKVNGKRLIGSTLRKFSIRWSEHKYRLRKGKYGNSHLQASWLKYGEDNFIFEIICPNKWNTEEKLREMETLFINFYKSYDNRFGYNMSEVSTAPLAGRKLSKEHKNKIGFGGRKHTEKSKKRISNAHIGMSPSEETREKLRKSNKGRKHTDAQIKKMKEMLPRGEKHFRTTLTQVEVDTIRETYSNGNTSANKLAKEYKVTKRTILNIINNVTWKTCYTEEMKNKIENVIKNNIKTRGLKL